MRVQKRTRTQNKIGYKTTYVLNGSGKISLTIPNKDNFHSFTHKKKLCNFKEHVIHLEYNTNIRVGYRHRLYFV